MAIFEPDIFSVSRQITSKVSDEKEREITGILGKYFNSLIDSHVNIQQFGGMEINSNNYLIRDKKSAFVLKKFNVLSDKSRQFVTNQLDLAMKLKVAGLPLPNFLKPDGSDEFLFEEHGAQWVLMTFIDGDFFTGACDEHKSAIKVVLDLWDTLSAIKPMPELPMIHPVNTGDMELLDQIHATPSFSECFPGLSQSDLKNILEQIERELIEVLTIRNDLMSSYAACHIDMHPHNLLTKNSEVVAILDVESFQTAPRYAALAFNLFKQSRQAVVFQQLNNMQINDLKRSIYQALESRNIISDVSKLKVYAKAEILRRIFIILRLNLQGNHRWNHVLPIQINALKEANLTI
jgi:hypothetical protein